MINVNFLTPMPSLLFLGILSVGMIFVSDIYILINYLAFTECSVVAMSVLSLLKLRLTRPDLKRPIKVRKFVVLLDARLLDICTLNRYILVPPRNTDTLSHHLRVYPLSAFRHLALRADSGCDNHYFGDTFLLRIRLLAGQA